MGGEGVAGGRWWGVDGRRWSLSITEICQSLMGAALPRDNAGENKDYLFIRISQKEIKAKVVADGWGTYT